VRVQSIRSRRQYCLLLALSGCDLLAQDAKPVLEIPVPTTQYVAGAPGAGAGGQAGNAGRGPFLVMTVIRPASMPLAGSGAGTGASVPTASSPTAGQAAAQAAAGTSGTLSLAAAGAGGAVVPNGAPATTPNGTAGAAATVAAGAAAAPPVAGAPSPADDVPFDEARGRSRGTAPLGTPVPMGGVECTNEVCLPLPALSAQASAAGVMIALCCTAAGECGTKGGGPMSMGDPNECRIIPDSDPQCPRVEIMGFELASCCTADGKCGLNAAAFGMKPCSSIEEAMQMFGSFIELPMPSACLPGMGPPNSSSAPAPAP